MINRLDMELVKRNLFKTRTKAKEAISVGNIYCDGKKITKAGFLVKDTTKIEIKGDICPYVSRGGLKLKKAIDYFNISLLNKSMIDIGSSTGGFTDCALQHGIKKVIAIDVGTNQFDNILKKNHKVELYEETDFRNIDNHILNESNIATIDISFISVLKILPKINEINSLNEIICLIKPQFECGKQIADKFKGIVLDKDVHEMVINNIIKGFSDINFYCNNITYSPISGGNGNIEYLAYFVKDNAKNSFNIKEVIEEGFNKLKSQL